jgi:hypothetical protein
MLGALATFAAAQDISTLPECGQFCAEDMVTGQASGLGCSANDLQCLCQNINFIYGLRDCSAATCSPEDAQRIVEYGIAVCRDAGVVVTTGMGDMPTATASTILTTISSGDSAISTTPVATTTISDDDEEATSTDGGSEVVSTMTSEDTTVVSTMTSDGTTVVTTISTVTDEAGATGTETSTEEEGAARTMAPVGVLAAGLAVLLL